MALLDEAVGQIEKVGTAPRLAPQLNQLRAGRQKRARHIQRRALVVGADIRIDDRV